MKDMIEAGNYLGLSGTIIAIIISLFLVINIITGILDAKGKIAPTFLNIRKFFRDRKEKKKEKIAKEQAKDKLLADVDKTLKEVNSHYSADNINMRNQWMQHVEDKEKLYDESVKTLARTNDHLDKLERKMDEMLLEQNKTFLHSCVDKILKISKYNNPSEEDFKHAFELHEEYEILVKKTNDPNHRVDVAMEVINEKYKEFLRYSNK